MLNPVCAVMWASTAEPIRAYPAAPGAAECVLHSCSKPTPHGEFHVCACGVALRAREHVG